MYKYFIKAWSFDDAPGVDLVVIADNEKSAMEQAERMISKTDYKILRVEINK